MVYTGLGGRHILGLREAGGGRGLAFRKLAFCWQGHGRRQHYRGMVAGPFGREAAEKKTDFHCLGKISFEKNELIRKGITPQSLGISINHTSIYHGSSNFNLPYGFHFTTVD